MNQLALSKYFAFLRVILGEKIHTKQNENKCHVTNAMKKNPTSIQTMKNAFLLMLEGIREVLKYMSQEMHSVRCTNDNDLGKDPKHCERNSNRHQQAEQIHFLRYYVWEVSQQLI